VRINKLAPFFAELCNAELKTNPKISTAHLIDSVPIVVAKGSRSNKAKAVSELCDKGYCSSQKMWYYGVKIHILAEERPHSVPIPREILITKASEHDLSAGKKMLENADSIEIFADKAYIDDDWGYDLQLRFVEVNTQFKERGKNQLPLDDGELAWNAMVSSRRQAIEVLFSKISRLTGIQNASFVRSPNALLAFLWARLTLLAFSYS